MKILFLVIGLFCFSSTQAQLVNDICGVFGQVYFTDRIGEADFVIYDDEEEAFADLVVFFEDSYVYADEPGHWYVTKNKQMADYILYVSGNASNAHFRIFFTKEPSFAGCP